jgi:hypothetical protein
MKRGLSLFVVLGAALVASQLDAADPPATWDGLVQVESNRMDVVFLQPDADFRTYTKVMLDPTEVAFEKNWQRDYNRSTSTLSNRVDDRDVQNAVRRGVVAANDIFADAWTKGGYTVVTEPGPDVLRVRPGVLNIRVNAPDVMTSARSRTYAEEAGQATYFVEIRDSLTGALLGRAADQRIVGDNMAALRNSVTNRDDFRDEVKRWAEITVRGMNELKARSPIAQ